MSNSTVPPRVAIFDTNSGSWRVPPLAIVAPTVAISSGVVSIDPNVSVRIGVSVVCLIPIRCAVAMTLSRPTASDVRTYAQFTESTVASRSVM